MSVEDDSLDAEAAAHYLGISPTSVYRYVRQGRLPAASRRPTRIPRAALDQFIERARMSGSGG